MSDLAILLVAAALGALGAEAALTLWLGAGAALLVLSLICWGIDTLAARVADRLRFGGAR